MQTNWNKIQGPLVASIFGLEFSAMNSRWQSWIDGLQENEALTLRGEFTQRFGRAKWVGTVSDPKQYLMKYVGELEKEISGWLAQRDEVVDYVIASKCDNGDPSASWYWLPAHQELWAFRKGKRDPLVTVPEGVRLIPLVDSSLMPFVSNHLLDPLTVFFDAAKSDSRKATELISWIESGCGCLGIPPEDVFGEILPILRRLRESDAKQLQEKILRTERELNELEDRKRELDPKSASEAANSGGSSIDSSPYSAPWGEVG